MNQRQQQQLMKQMQQMQRQMEQVQQELSETMLEGSAGGGVVLVTMNGHREVQAVKISPEAVDPDEVDILQDMVLAAINDASQKAQKLTEERMGPFTQGLGGMMPGM